MPRARLTDAEREERRRERSRRSFSEAAYHHYSPAKEGYGSPDEWMRAAEEMANGSAGFGRIEGTKSPAKTNADLQALGLDEVPRTKQELLRTFRAAAMTAHPDHGGSNEAIRAVLDAYQRLLMQIG